MKKYFILAAAAAMVLGACSKNEVNFGETADDAISFSTYMPKATKAGYGLPLTSDNIKDAKAGFGVFATYSSNATYEATQGPNFMYNQLVSFDGANWSYAPLKYWPNEHGNNAKSLHVDRLSFFAYAPYVSTETLAKADSTKAGIVAVTGNDATTDPMVTYVVSHDVVNCKPVDLTWAVAQTAVSETNANNGTNSVAAGMPFLNLVKPVVNYTIPFYFKHALTSLKVTVQGIFDETTADPATTSTADVDSKTKIYVRKIEIKTDGYGDKGKLNLNNTTANEPNWIIDYDTDTLHVFTLNDGLTDGTETTADANEINGLGTDLIQGGAGVTNAKVDLSDYYLIPIKGASAYTKITKVTIYYDVETEDAALNGTLTDTSKKGSVVENIIYKDGLNIELKPNKKNTLNLTVGMASVQVSATVETWDTGEVEQVDLPANV